MVLAPRAASKIDVEIDACRDKRPEWGRNKGCFSLNFIGLCKTLAKPWHSNLQRRAPPDPPKFFNYDFFIVKLILA
jgi:hypothetical protein